MFQDLHCTWCSRVTRFVAGDGFAPRCTACGKTTAEAISAPFRNERSEPGQQPQPPKSSIKPFLWGAATVALIVALVSMDSASRDRVLAGALVKTVVYGGIFGGLYLFVRMLTPKPK